EPYELHFRTRRTDGAWRWHLTPAAAFRHRDGELVEWYGSAIDIHDAIELKRRAEDLARRFATTLESVTDAFFMVDRDWRFTFLNSEAERVLERPRDELLGVALWDAFPEALDTEAHREYTRAMRENRSVEFR